MTGSPESDRDAAIFDFVSMFCADRADGVMRPLADYLGRFPGHEAAIEAEHRRLEAEQATAPAPARRVGHYEVLETLGSGGQGVVLLAEDSRLRRRVALKVLAPHLDFVSTERLQRFRREAEILSQLDHPGICQVYEADTSDGVPFLAMRFVEGRTLAAILRERRSGRELPRTRAQIHEVVQWIEFAARAVHEAHENGIVHRDIKPGNLMITPAGTPVLLDFGLARNQEHSDVEITRTGDVFGTLAYMAPELLERRPADHRTDVYALGVTLYESLTHALPFAAESQSALWRAIATGHATSARHHNPAIPPELAAVLATAIAPQPTNRYQSAAELAADLERVRRREPIRARRVPLAVRTLRWVQRHPTWSLGLAAAATSILILAVSLDRVRANERAAMALNQAIQPSTDDGAAAALANLVAAAASSPRTDLRNAMLQLLDACHLSWQVPRTPVPALTVDPPPAIDPTGRFAALGDHDGAVTLVDTATGERLAHRRVHAAATDDVAFLDDARVASAGMDGVSVLAAPDLRELRRLPIAHDEQLAAETAAAAALAVAPDGRRLAVAAPGMLSLFDTVDWSRAAAIRLDLVAAIRRVLWSPSGRYLAVLGREGGPDPHGCNHFWIVDTLACAVTAHEAMADQAVLWAEWHPRQPVLALAGNGGRVEIRAAADGARRFHCVVGQEVNWCGFDPDGSVLLVPSDRGTDLWRWSDGATAPVAHLTHPSERTIGAAQFDRERQLFAAVLRDGLVLVYSTRDWRLLRQFKVRVTDVRYLGWLPQSGSLLTADLESLCCWLAGVRPHSPELWGHEGAVTTVALHPHDRLVLSGSRDHTARLWSLDRAAPRCVLPHPGALRRVRFDADGRRFLTVAEDHDLRVWDTANGRLLQLLHGHAAEVADAWFLPDGGRVLSIGDDGRTIVWDLASGKALRTMAASNAPLRSAALHPTQPWIAVGGADRHMTVWNFETGEQLRRIFCSTFDGDWRIDPVHQVRGLAFDPSGDHLLASLVNNFLYVWDLRADWQLHAIEGDRYGGPIAVDPRTGTAVCADYSFGKLSLHADGRVARLLVDGGEAHSNRISAVRIAPELGVALSAAHDGLLQVWDLESRTPLQTIRLPTAILDADFSADGRWIATGDADGHVKLWPRDPLATAKAYLARRDAGRHR